MQDLEITNKLKTLAGKFSGLGFFMGEELTRILQEREIGQFAAELNTVQLWDGIDAKGKDIQPPYARSTIDYKKAEGQPFDRVTLRDTGDLYDDLMPTEIKGGIALYSDRPYTEDLETHYANHWLFGLNDSSRFILVGKIKPIIKKRVKEWLLYF